MWELSRGYKAEETQPTKRPASRSNESSSVSQEEAVSCREKRQGRTSVNIHVIKAKWYKEYIKKLHSALITLLKGADYIDFLKYSQVLMYLIDIYLCDKPRQILV